MQHHLGPGEKRFGVTKLAIIAVTTNSGPYNLITCLCS